MHNYYGDSFWSEHNRRLREASQRLNDIWTHPSRGNVPHISAACSAARRAMAAQELREARSMARDVLAELREELS